MSSVLEKVTSGRWLITACVGTGWLYLVVTGGVNEKDAFAAFLLIANWYFNRTDRDQEKQKPNETSTP